MATLMIRHISMQKETTISAAITNVNGSEKVEGGIDASFGSFVTEDFVWAETVPCGYHKCFFRSKTKPHLGYLVSRFTPGRRAMLEMGWRITKQLEQEFEIKQFVLEPPLEINASHEVVAHLNHGLGFVVRDNQPLNQRKDFKYNGFFMEGSPSYVQRVQVAPVPNFILGPSGPKREHLYKHFDKFLSSISADSKKDFARLFIEQLEIARRIIAKEPCMIKDFQVMVDKTGQFYHLDMDRCLESIGGKVVKRIMSWDSSESCLAFLDDLETYVQRNLLFGGNQTYQDFAKAKMEASEMVRSKSPKECNAATPPRPLLPSNSTGRAFVCVTGKDTKYFVSEKIKETLLEPLKEQGYEVDVALVWQEQAKVKGTHPVITYQQAHDYLSSVGFNVLTHAGFVPPEDLPVPPNYLTGTTRSDMPKSKRIEVVKKRARKFKASRKCHEALLHQQVSSSADGATPNENYYDFSIVLGQDVSLQEPICMDDILRLLYPSRHTGSVLGSDCRTFRGMNERLFVVSREAFHGFFNGPWDHFFLADTPFPKDGGEDIVFNLQRQLQFIYQEHLSMNVIQSPKIRGEVKFVMSNNGTVEPAPGESKTFC